MSVYDETFDRVIERALNILFAKKADIYTFAFYYDHETKAVCICADTKINSRKMALQTNAFKYEHLRRSIEKKDLKRAMNFGWISERSFSLGDFTFKDLGWTSIAAPNNSQPFYLAMVRALMRHMASISALSRSPEELVFCCSTKDSEVGLSWFYQTAAQSS